MLPTHTPPKVTSTSRHTTTASISKYRPTEKTNLFSSEGVIPPALNAEAGKQEESFDGPAVKTNLNIELLGTIVHADERKSIATISNGQKGSSLRINEEMDGLLEVIQIERKKVTFKNLNSKRREYVEIPEDIKIAIALNKPKPRGPIIKDDSDESNVKMTISRDEVNKYTSDLFTTLKQARVVPHRENGELVGFKFVSIRPNSVFQKLGMKNGDIITSVNGEKITSPAQAMETYQALRESDNVQLGTIRGGKKRTTDYNITN